MSSLTKLDFIRLHTSLSCDSFDVDVVKEFGPFVNCTSNQAIIYGELIKESNVDVISKAAELARTKYGSDDENVLLQSYMYAAYSRDETVEDVRAIIDLFRYLSPETSVDRICIKIPATYEGLEACRILKGLGIKTLATCVFSFEQAILASEVGCCFLSPYINELKVHFTPGMIDEHKLFPTIRQIYEYYEDHGISTKIILGSFVSSEEVMEVSGIHGVTLPPLILKELSSTLVSPGTTLSYPPRSTQTVKAPERVFLDNEHDFREALSGDKEAARKLQEAIAAFLGFENQLESIMRNAIQKLV
ncbi:hypothetical protein Clacol_004619 [Clathrus columnatus]|uniref:Transaldolase n=1 Tax=Clathrus columnatus TaxID=1419009 RepID=A0AAV5ACM5_9AGAM|nr:hypothetical protein Clacol_004619 [Clathrus columnatus]